MRYREGQSPDSALAGSGTGDVLIFTLLLGIVFGLVLLGLGIKGKQIWLITWSIGLVVVSIATWIWMVA
tara:strand:+ start:414 stop:620 length:207 start_codon:yes stop_codon:yes gene_type:complete